MNYFGWRNALKKEFLALVCIGCMCFFFGRKAWFLWTTRMGKDIGICVFYFCEWGPYAGHADWRPFSLYFMRFSSLICVWELWQNFSLLICLQIFIVLDSIACIFSMRCLGCWNYIIYTNIYSKYQRSCLVR